MTVSFIRLHGEGCLCNSSPVAKQALEIKDSQIKNKRKSTDYNESGEVLFSPLPCGGYFNFGLFIRTLRLRLTKICEYAKNIPRLRVSEEHFCF